MTTVYIEGIGGAALAFYGLKKSGAVKWVMLGAGAYLLYSAYQGYQAS